MTVERDLAAAAKVTYAYEHGKPERPSLEHHIAEAIAAARAEGIAEGEKRERDRCLALIADRADRDHLQVTEIGNTTVIRCLLALSAAIRAANEAAGWPSGEAK